MCTTTILSILLFIFVPTCAAFQSHLYLPVQTLCYKIKSKRIYITCPSVHQDSKHAQLRSIGSGTSTCSRPGSDLCSTLFDDADLDWDNDDDEDDFDIQINSIFDGYKDPNKGHEDGAQSGKQPPKINLNDLDDTDEDYYEQLFLQQSLEMGEEEKSKVVVIKEEISSDPVGAAVENLSISIDYEKTIALRKEWKEKIHQMRNESVQTRKLRRKSNRRMKLEERASFLALRALRMQTMPLEEPALLLLDNYSNREEKKKETTRGSGVVVRKRRPRTPPPPIPTMSLSSSRNYKRKEDEMDEHEMLLEQKLFGKRFKDAKKVYIRLLEFVEERRSESTSLASELIADRMEEECSLALSISGNGKDMDEDDLRTDHMSVKKCRMKYIDKVTRMNDSHQSLMATLVRLSLNGKYALLDLLDDVDTDDDIDDDDKFENLSVVTLDLHLRGIDAEDLCNVLRIRGNVKRRGRLPKERMKVLECLKESFSKPLF